MAVLGLNEGQISNFLVAQISRGDRFKCCIYRFHALCLTGEVVVTGFLGGYMRGPPLICFSMKYKALTPFSLHIDGVFISFNILMDF